MGIFSKAKKLVKKTVKNLTGGNNKPQRPDAAMGPAGDTGSRARSSTANRTRMRRSRGRDSTIITARSEIGSRTLLG